MSTTQCISNMQSFAGCNNVGLDVRACLLPNKDQTNVLAVPANPINICSSPVSDINTTDHSSDMQSNSLLYNPHSESANWLEAGGGSSVSTDASMQTHG